MNEYERRKVTVHNQIRLLGARCSIERPATGEPGFWLFADGNEQAIASCLSDAALSDYAFRCGASEVVSRYDLAEGDMGR